VFYIINKIFYELHLLLFSLDMII